MCIKSQMNRSLRISQHLESDEPEKKAVTLLLPGNHDYVSDSDYQGSSIKDIHIFLPFLTFHLSPTLLISIVLTQIHSLSLIFEPYPLLAINVLYGRTLIQLLTPNFVTFLIHIPQYQGNSCIFHRHGKRSNPKIYFGLHFCLSFH